MAAALNFAPRIQAPAIPSDRPGPSERSGNAPTMSGPRTRSQARPEPAAVYLRRRIAVGVLLVLIGALAWTIGAAVMGVGDRAAAGPVSTPDPVEPSTYVVGPGDTLWSIASSMDVDGDIRRLVDELAELNGGSVLQVGQVVELPSG